MKYSFSDVISKMHYDLQHRDTGFKMPLTPKLNRLVGNINKGLYTAIIGNHGSGTSSFVNQNYVLGPLIQWYILPEDERPPLKIMYFNLSSNELKCFQQLICLYGKLVHGVHLDIPTLNSKPSRLFDIDQSEQALGALDQAGGFFDAVLGEQLEIISGGKKPTDIHNLILTEYSDFYEKHEDKGHFMVVIDSTEHLMDEDDGFMKLTGKALDEKMDKLIQQVVSKTLATVTVVAPPHIPIVRGNRDTEPQQSHLGKYANCHRGIEIYNPIAERDPLYINNKNLYVGGKSGMNTLRTWTIIRNTEGSDLISNIILFLAGNGFMIELQDEKDIMSFDDTKVYILAPNKSPYYGCMDNNEEDE